MDVKYSSEESLAHVNTCTFELCEVAPPLAMTALSLTCSVWNNLKPLYCHYTIHYCMTCASQIVYTMNEKHCAKRLV